MPPLAARGSGIRWDRVSRIALLLVLGLIMVLYIGPLRSYISTWRDSKARHAEVVRLQSANRRLLARRNQLERPDAVEREARRLGMVKPGERAFVVRGLPRGN